MSEKAMKVLNLLELAAIYLISFGIGFLPFPFLLDAGVPALVDILICDVITTVAVYIAGLIKKTPSVYDPYWSVQTLIISILLLVFFHSFHPIFLLVLIPILVYSARLTVHFGITFSGWDYVDWRYVDFKERNPRAFQLINFFGIHLFPTLLVYAGSAPFFLFFIEGLAAYENNPVLVTLLCSFFFFLSLGAVAISFFADRTMAIFIKNRFGHSEVCQKGLWAYSRHPNYLGEISFWFTGIFVLVCLPYHYYWFILAPIAILLMFLFYSIPAIERRMCVRKSLYPVYQKEVWMLPLLPRKKRRRKPTDYDSQDS